MDPSALSSQKALLHPLKLPQVLIIESDLEGVQAAPDGYVILEFQRAEKEPSSRIGIRDSIPASLRHTFSILAQQNSTKGQL